MHVIDAGGQAREMFLGPDPDKNESFQAVARAGCWFRLKTERIQFSSRWRAVLWLLDLNLRILNWGSERTCWCSFPSTGN